MLIPLHCEYFALEGLADLVGTMRRVRAALNPALDIEGVLLTMFDERTNLGQQVANDVRQFFKEKVFRTVIPRNVRLGEAPSHGMPVILYDVKSRGAEAYLALAREVLERSRRPRRDATQLARASQSTVFLCVLSVLCVVDRSWRLYGETTRPRQRPERADSRRARATHCRRSKSTSTACRRTTCSRAGRWTTRRSSELAQSITSNGIIQPIVVRKVGDRFQIIAGERRWRAAKIAGLLRVPVVVREVRGRRRARRSSRWRSSRTSSART